MNKITLKLESKTITLNTHEVQGQTLYKAQDLLIGYGLDTTKASKTVDNFKVSMKNKLPEFQVVSKQGKNGGTYLNKRQILKLAGYVSYEFEDAVYEAFEALVNGEVDKALDIALDRVKVGEVMESKSRLPKIKPLWTQSDMEIDVFVETFLKFATRHKVTLEQRLKTAKALESLVNKHYDKLSAREFHKAAACERALRYIAQYEKAKATQVKSIKATVAQRHFGKAVDVAEQYHQKQVHTRDTAIKIGVIAKGLQHKCKQLESSISNPF